MNQNQSSSAVHIYCAVAVLNCLGVNCYTVLAVLVTFLYDSGVLFILTVWWPRPLLHWGGFLIWGFPRKQQFLPTGQNQLAVRENLQVHKKTWFFFLILIFFYLIITVCAWITRRHAPHCSPEEHFLAINNLEQIKLLLFSLLSKSHYYLHLVKGHGLFFSINLNSLHPRMLLSI